MAKGGLDRWNHIFRIACLLEADLFNTGLQAPTPYNIVPNGTYSIQNSSSPTRVVLTNQSPQASIVGVDKTGGNGEKVIRDALASVCLPTNPFYSGMSS
jgi:hypothetical protein